MTSTNIDYVDTYFEFPTLTKIHGEPTYFQLKELKNELKSNASSVTTDLGGGANGHLGLVLTPAEYNAVSATAYNRPTHPGNLNIAAGTAQHEATRLRNEHKEAVRLFRETIDVEKALIKQVVAALEPKYLKSLRNANSNAITRPLHEVLDYLFTKYGVVNADTLMDIEDKVKTMEYSLSDPLIVMFNEIEELERLGIAATNPYREMQLVQIGLKIIKNTNDIEDAINKWYSRPAAEHTWNNFKNHFEDARELLKKVRGENMQTSSFQQANYVANEVSARIARTQESILQAFAAQQQTMAEQQTAMTAATERNEEVNAATTESTQLAILQLLKAIKDEMKTTNPVRTPRRKFYCWTHGGCNHQSSECRNKKDGHQDNATFRDKKGGSTKGCTNA